MFGWRMVPDWFEIESRFSEPFIAFTASAASSRYPEFERAPSYDLIRRRISSVREALWIAETEVATLLLKRFSELDIRVVLRDLVDVVKDMAMILVGSALTGGIVGGGIGFLAGGIGVFPGAMGGAFAGVKAGTWILGVLGLASITEFVTEGLNPIIAGYAKGLSTAWNGPNERTNNPMSFHSDDPWAAKIGGKEIARSHEAVVVLLLGGIVAYLTRGRGNASVLAGEMQRSERGAKLGQWMVKHEEALKQHPDLKPPEPRSGALGSGNVTPPQSRPSANDKDRSQGRPNTMALHEVECFKADKMPTSKIGEFERQLQGQEDGLNRLTVGEYLENIANPVKRNRAAARSARKLLQDQLEERFQNDFSNLDPVAAEQAAIRKAKETMASLAGLHNPDLSAGGKDIVGDFGDRQVNSSIGPQWRSKIQNLRGAAEKVPDSLRSSTFLNVKLHKC